MNKGILALGGGVAIPMTLVAGIIAGNIIATEREANRCDAALAEVEQNTVGFPADYEGLADGQYLVRELLPNDLGMADERVAYIYRILPLTTARMLVKGIPEGLFVEGATFKLREGRMVTKTELPPITSR
ncbi:MAG: hypothetical protein AAB686_03745 [Patescibacteria group bacterium]